MLAATVVLVSGMAGAGAPPTSAAEEEASVARRRPSHQCRVVEPSARLSGRRGVRGEAAVLERSQARARAALPREERKRKREQIRRGPFYSASRTVDLELGVVVRRSVPSDARVELRLLTPRGHPYQTLRVGAPVEETASEKAAKRRSADRSAERSAGGKPKALTAAVPVAGTAIVNHSLYGQWTVEPRLDGRPCGPPVRFWIGE